jgi:hypothetical protein
MSTTHCPKCKSDNVAYYSRKKYFFRSAGCLTVILFCLYTIYGLKDEDPNPVVLIGIFGSLFFISLSTIFLIYYLIKGIRQKEAGYQCGFCKNKFSTGLIIQDPGEEDLLRTVRKVK